MNEEKETVLEETVIETEQPQAKKIDWKAEIWDMAKLLVFWSVIFFILVKFVVNPIQVIGESMYPTLKDHARGFSNIISTYISEPSRYDIVVVQAKDGSKDHWVKRVIGMPNDTIYCKNNVVYVNDEPIEEAYLDAEYRAEIEKQYGYFTRDFEAITLEEDEYFLMGDNRVHSTDSRVVGPFTKEEITSMGVMIYYPFNEFGIK